MLSASRIALIRALMSVQRLSLRRNQIVQQSPFCSSKNSVNSVPLAQLEKKMQMIYTCKVCSTRNSQTISKIAYSKGVVLVRCEGCSNLHLVADNLGWFRDTKTNIEDILREKGETVKKVSLGNDFLEFVKEIEK